jgi:hypothetical protein
VTVFGIILTGGEQQAGEPPLLAAPGWLKQAQARRPSRDTRLLECPRNTGIPGIRPGRRIPGRLVGIVSSLEAKLSEKLFENRPGSTT